MSQPIPVQIRLRDLAIGFFGWAIYYNIAFMAWLLVYIYAMGREESAGYSVFFIMTIALVIGILFLIQKEKYWILLGSVVALLASSIAMELILPHYYGLTWWNMPLMPFPTGIFYFLMYYS